MKTILATMAMLFLFHAGASSPAMARPCNIMCPVDTFPNRDKCKCEPMMSPIIFNPCMLVCLGPDQVLDDKKCRCVTPGGKGMKPIIR